MKRLFFIFVMAALAMSAMAGCSSKKEVTKYEVEKKSDDKTDDATASDDSDSADIAADSDEAEKKAVDVKELASSLLKEISYDDELSDIDLDTANMFLNISDIDIVDSAIYESSGGTAEEIVVLKCADSDGAAKAKAAFNQRVSEQTDNFTDYVPSEVPKLKDAVIITSKEYAVLSVSGDSGKAKTIIEEAFTK